MSYTHTNDIIVSCQEDKAIIAKEFCDSLLEKYKGKEVFKSDDGRYHYIYLTINTKNNKFYVGKHTTDYLKDGYIGSGHHLIKAINKYGKDSFTHYRLCFFSNSEDAYKEEALIVDVSYIEVYRNKLQITYNLKSGGMGGTTPSEETRIKQRNVKLGKKMSLVARKRMSESNIRARKCPILRKRISDNAKKSNNRPGAREKMSLLVREIKSNRTLIDLDGNIHFLSKDDVLSRLKQKWKLASNKAYLFHPELFKNKDSLSEKDYYKSIAIKDRYSEEYQYQTIIDYLDDGWVLGCPSKIESEVRLTDEEVKFYLDKNTLLEKRIKQKEELIKKDIFSIKKLRDLEGNEQEVHINDILGYLKLGWVIPLKSIILYHKYLSEENDVESHEYRKTIRLVFKTVDTKTQHETLISYLENGWGFSFFREEEFKETVDYWLSKNKEIENDIYKRIGEKTKSREGKGESLIAYNKSMEGRIQASLRNREKYIIKPMIDLEGKSIGVEKSEVLEKLKMGWTLELKKIRVHHPILCLDKSLKESEYLKPISLIREGRCPKKAIKRLIDLLESGWVIGEPTLNTEKKLTQNVIIPDTPFCNKRRMFSLF
jgi:hypothetical protein